MIEWLFILVAVVAAAMIVNRVFPGSFPAALFMIRAHATGRDYFRGALIRRVFRDRFFTDSNSPVFGLQTEVRARMRALVDAEQASYDAFDATNAPRSLYLWVDDIVNRHAVQEVEAFFARRNSVTLREYKQLMFSLEEKQRAIASKYYEMYPTYAPPIALAVSERREWITKSDVSRRAELSDYLTREDIPDAVRDRIGMLKEEIDAAVDYLEGVPGAAQYLSEVTQIRDVHAIETVEAVDVMKAQASEPIQDGRSAWDLLEEQLDLLRAGVQDAITDASSTQATTVLANDQFLKDKYGASTRDDDLKL